MATHRFKGERTLMRIFIGESDKYEGKPLYEVLLHRLRKRGLAAAHEPNGCDAVGRQEVLHDDDSVVRRPYQSSYIGTLCGPRQLLSAAVCAIDSTLRAICNDVERVTPASSLPRRR